MKTSNYILLAFFTFVFGLSLTLFIDSKLHDKLSKKESAFVTEQKLDHFSVLVAEEQADITISFGLENKIISVVRALDQPKKQQSPKKFLRISNDTIFVKKADSVASLNIHCKSINKVIGNKNAKISIWSFVKDSLFVELNQSKLECYSHNVNTKSLSIVAKNHSNINFIPTIYYEMDNDGKKKMVYQEFMGFVKVSLKNHSKLNMRKPRRIDIEADSTSSYTFFN
jgi:hypothetical protein